MAGRPCRSSACSEPRRQLTAASTPTNYADGNVYRIATIRNITERGGYAPAMNTNIVPAEAQEEFDFMCDGLSTVINAFVSESILHGVTDESWNAYLKQLEQYNYDYYIEFFNNKLHNSF